MPPVAVAVLFGPMAMATEPLSEEAAVPISDVPLMDTLTIFGLVASALVEFAGDGAAARADGDPMPGDVAVRLCTFTAVRDQPTFRAWLRGPSLAALDEYVRDPESAGLAWAAQGIAITPAPMPIATANPPTRPTYLVYSIPDSHCR